jgi:hypothetical protein
VPRTRALATLPLNDPKVAEAALRGRLQLMLERTGGVPDWTTLRIYGPTTRRDARGREWFDWVATVRALYRPTDRVPVDEAPTYEELAVEAPEARPTVADLRILRAPAAG